MHIKLLRQNWVSDNNLLIANKSNCEKLCFCFEMKILYFQGIQIDVLSMVEVTKHVQPKIFDRKLLQLWFIQAPISLSTHTNWYTSSAGKVSSVGCSYSIYLSRYSLIFTHPGEYNSRTAAVLIPNILRWNAPMFYHFWCWTNAALMRTSTNNSVFQ